MFNLTIKNKNIFYFNVINILVVSFVFIMYLNKLNTTNFFFIENYTINNKILNTIFTLMIFTLLLISFINKQILYTNIYVSLIYFLFCLTLFFLTFTNSILIFFVAYEFLLLFTSIIVYFFSPNIRSKVITFYFVIWTQLSSFFLWLTIIYVFYKTNSFDINYLNVLLFDKSNSKLLSYLVFISFCIKLPLWPFSFWLIKTHVEANTSFSIFLSGVLVKTALLGLLKFNFILHNNNNVLFSYIIIFSACVSTFNLNYQTDFKKLIAFTTIQEMSIISLYLFFNSYINTQLILYFIILHTLISFFLFFLNDLIYIRFKTRKTNLHLGMMVVTPKLSLLLIIVWFLFVSLPLTLKFFFELLFLFKILSLNTIICITVIICLQYLTIIFFTKNVITYIFGNGNKFSNDISKNEMLLSFIILFLFALIVT